MMKETMDFIYSLKKPKNDSLTLRDNAIEYLAEWSGSEEEAYTENNLFPIILRYFLDYIDTADKPSSCVRQFFDSKRLRLIHKEVTGNDDRMTDTDFMLIALQLVQVKKDEQYINGFSEQGK